ncbi:hypothetical protein ATO12_23360 [Aquimarina atlantica]|uniref:AB hydrolase-1 domain-containing protein n=1 Tax=Aquimarina atlantica TaxID=1317122 RepID=A0A023BRC3_9FLAO|nr:alpha/beta hydrolase [Aquimarina atlantica]EZH72393.1 hypothetical protein ATO12_23360 [Aquimarina atlantica]
MANTSIYKNKETRDVIMKLYDEKLQSCKIEYEDIYVDTKAGKTHIITTGMPGNPPVIILHGINAGAPLAIEPIKNLRDDYRIYAIDTIGQTTKSTENRLPITDNSYGEWISEIMDILTIEKATIIGISYGAFLLQKIMSYQPEKVHKGIFVVPSGLVNGSFGTSMKYLTFPLLSFLFTKKEKYLLKFMNAFYTTIDEYSITFQKNVLLGTKMDYRRPPLLQKKDVKRLTAPVYAIFADNDIFFPGEKALKRCKEIFYNFQDSIFLKNTKHIPDQKTYVQIEKQISVWLKES